MKPKVARCERTGKRIPLREGFLVADASTGEWLFVSTNAPERAYDYDIQVASLVKSPEALVDWLAHLNEKSWFNPKKFFSYFERFRSDNDLYNAT